ncbi:MAG: deoxyribose-phosphate aldolase [Bacillota bacterium]
MTDQLAGYIEHTLLKPEAGKNEIIELCQEALKFSFYAVCINPSFVKTAAEELLGSAVKVCTVIGFPLGATTTETKACEAAEAVESGAGEVDMVIHVGALKSGSEQYLIDDISSVVQAAKGNPVKVIIETGFLDDEEKVLACRLAEKSGAHFVKNSTGFGPGKATSAEIKLMRDVVEGRLGVKASAGIKTRTAALEMINAGADRIGTSSGIDIICE